MAITNERVECKSCRYWDTSRFRESGKNGDCRRYAPQPKSRREIREKEGEYEVLWAVTTCFDYCGDWESKKKTRGYSAS